MVTNGMSEYPGPGEHQRRPAGERDAGGLRQQPPLAGIAFQRRLEEAAFRLGGGGYAAPRQRVEDFLAGRPSTGPGR